MSKHIVQFEIDCGEKTCASEPGKFCEFLGTQRFGTIPLCLLFPQSNPEPGTSASATPLKDRGGWLQRCEACLNAGILQ